MPDSVGDYVGVRGGQVPVLAHLPGPQPRARAVVDVVKAERRAWARIRKIHLRLTWQQHLDDARNGRRVRWKGASSGSSDCQLERRRRQLAQPHAIGQHVRVGRRQMPIAARLATVQPAALARVGEFEAYGVARLALGRHERGDDLDAAGRRGADSLDGCRLLDGRRRHPQLHIAIKYVVRGDARRPWRLGRLGERSLLYAARAEAKSTHRCGGDVRVRWTAMNSQSASFGSSVSFVVSVNAPSTSFVFM